MDTYWNEVYRELKQQRMLRPVLVTSAPFRRLGQDLTKVLKGARLTAPGESSLMGRDVVLIHAGETGWEELLNLICRESPGRLFVVAPECPRSEAWKLEWVADRALVGNETYTYEMPELMSA